jgi:hypothetical protein
MSATPCTCCRAARIRADVFAVAQDRYTSYLKARTTAPTLLFAVSNFTLAHTGNLDTDYRNANGLEFR